MAAPTTINASGYFSVSRQGTNLGEGVIRMPTATKGSLELGGQIIKLTGNPAAKTLRGKLGAQTFTLKITNRNLLSGNAGSDKLELVRRVRREIPAGEMSKFDAGPPATIQAILNATPDYLAATGDPSIFWHHFGNVYYRGRMDGTARILCIASDPGPAECLQFARRTLIGDSGQKTQGFLARLGLTRSYVLVNVFAGAMHPSAKAKGLAVMKNK